jgi:general L-amino acid transport system substrate-binding protein
VIASVGNYSEIYLRHYGPDTAIGMEQGVNKPWSRGGLLFAPLFL